MATLIHTQTKSGARKKAKKPCHNNPCSTTVFDGCASRITLPKLQGLYRKVQVTCWPGFGGSLHGEVQQLIYLARTLRAESKADKVILRVEGIPNPIRVRYFLTAPGVTLCYEMPDSVTAPVINGRIAIDRTNPTELKTEIQQALARTRSIVPKPKGIRRKTQVSQQCCFQGSLQGERKNMRYLARILKKEAKATPKDILDFENAFQYVQLLINEIDAGPTEPIRQAWQANADLVTALKRIGHDTIADPLPIKIGILHLEYDHVFLPTQAYYSWEGNCVGMNTEGALFTMQNMRTFANEEADKRWLIDVFVGTVLANGIGRLEAIYFPADQGECWGHELCSDELDFPEALWSAPGTASNPGLIPSATLLDDRMRCAIAAAMNRK